MADRVSAAHAAALLDAVRTGLVSDELGAPLGRPVLVVDLDDTPPGADLRPPAGLPCVVIAVSTAPHAPPAPTGPDVLLSGADDAPAPWVAAGTMVDQMTATVEDAVIRHPQAATTLAQVLRVGRTLGLAEALVVESLAYSTLQGGPEHQSWLSTRTLRPADNRSDPAVTLDRQGDTLAVTLDRPERRNAYSVRMRDDLVTALQTAAADPSITAVHVRGNGPSFCSGGDLAEFGTRPNPATAHSVRTLRSAGWWLTQIADRVTVHLHGACVGAGIELSAFAGTVEATDDTAIALPEVGMGLIPGAGGTASIAKRAGPARTAWLAISGQSIDATTAQQWGLVDRRVPPEPTTEERTGA